MKPVECFESILHRHENGGVEEEALLWIEKGLLLHYFQGVTITVALQLGKVEYLRSLRDRHIQAAFECNGDFEALLCELSAYPKGGAREAFFALKSEPPEDWPQWRRECYFAAQSYDPPEERQLRRICDKRNLSQCLANACADLQTLESLIEENKENENDDNQHDFDTGA